MTASTTPPGARAPGDAHTLKVQELQQQVHRLEDQAAAVRRAFFELYNELQGKHFINPLNPILNVYEKARGISMRSGWLAHWRNRSHPRITAAVLQEDIPFFNTSADIYRLYRFLEQTRYQDHYLRRLVATLAPINRIHPELEQKQGELERLLLQGFSGTPAWRDE